MHLNKANVLYATESKTDLQVAVKKSRVSLRIKRTILRHEVRILRFLEAHPSIPRVYGYCRLPHFELIAMEMLGDCIHNLCPSPMPTPLRTVTLIAQQMVSRYQMFLNMLLMKSSFQHLSIFILMA